MTALGLIVAALLGLFWAGRRRAWYTTNISNNYYTDVNCDSDSAYDDAEALCASDDNDSDDAGYSSDDTSSGSSGSDDEINGLFPAARATP